jgi:hypothetical protein
MRSHSNYRPGSRIHKFYHPTAYFTTEEKAIEAARYLHHRFPGVTFNVKPYSPKSAVEKITCSDRNWALQAEGLSEERFQEALETSGTFEPCF